MARSTKAEAQKENPDSVAAEIGVEGIEAQAQRLPTESRLRPKAVKALPERVVSDRLRDSRPRCRSPLQPWPRISPAAEAAALVVLSVRPAAVEAR